MTNKALPLSDEASPKGIAKCPRTGDYCDQHDEIHDSTVMDRIVHKIMAVAFPFVLGAILTAFSTVFSDIGEVKSKVIPELERAMSGQVQQVALFHLEDNISRDVSVHQIEKTTLNLEHNMKRFFTEQGYEYIEVH